MPVNVRLATVNGAVPVFVTVIVPVFEEPTLVDAMLKLLVLKLIAGATAVLLKLTILGLPVAL